MVGLLAVEMFATKDGQVLVNEVAPRTHNSGHHTIEGNITSQFEQHVRAVCGLPLVSPATVQPAVMENLLYEEAIAQACVEETELPHVQGIGVHWYGKSQPRPLRKMGHLTAMADSVADAAQLADMSIDLLQQQEG